LLAGFVLLLHVREKSHEAGAFDCGFYCALLFGGEACALAAHDAAVRIYELLQEVCVLIVYVAYVVLREDVHMI